MELQGDGFEKGCKSWKSIASPGRACCLSWAQLADLARRRTACEQSGPGARQGQPGASGHC